LRTRPDGPGLHLARGLAVAALLGAGAALALTGHASSAAPRLLARASVLLHAVCVAVWIGALVPLWMLLRAEAGAVELARFSRVAPLALLLLIATGVILAALQLDRLDALWTTRYGLVLGGKIVGVAALLGLAGVNRLLLAPKFFAHDPAEPAARRRLTAALAVETAVALAIFGVVALWRFTPPPRALAAAFEHVSIHFHGQRAMAQIEMEPRRVRGAAVEIQILDGEFRPLPAKEVTLVLSNRAAGIEPMQRAAAGQGDGHWHVDDLPIPLAGRWRLRVEILVGDFDKVTLDDDVLLPRSP
jgi:copper transport protein